MKNNKWEIEGYYATSGKKQAILLPDYCDNCKTKELHKIRRFSTFEIKKLIFIDETTSKGK